MLGDAAGGRNRLDRSGRTYGANPHGATFINGHETGRYQRFLLETSDPWRRHPSVTEFASASFGRAE